MFIRTLRLKNAQKFFGNIVVILLVAISISFEPKDKIRTFLWKRMHVVLSKRFVPCNLMQTFISKNAIYKNVYKNLFQMFL